MYIDGMEDEKLIGKETRLSRNIKAKISDKRAFQTIVQLLGDLESEEGIKVMAEGGVPMPGGGAKVSQIMAVVQAQFNRAKGGDTSAATFIRDSGWGKPSAEEANGGVVEKMAISADVMKLLQARAQERLGSAVVEDGVNKNKDYVEISIDEATGMPKLCGEVKDA